MRQLPKDATPEEILVNKRQWADKTRLARMPYKRCHDCGLEKPNSEQFFPLVGPHGNRISVFCRDCVNRALLEKRPQACPICGQRSVLKVDYGCAHTRSRICDRCLKLVNTIRENREFIDNVMEYYVWAFVKKEAG
jgi:hypothetical protein